MRLLLHARSSLLHHIVLQNTSSAGGPAPPQFPHIYGPISPLTCVTAQYPVARAPDGTFLVVEGL